MSKLLPLQYAKILYNLTKDAKDDDLSERIDAFVGLLKKNQSLNKVSYIIKEFEAYVRKVENCENAEIKTARLLSEKNLEEIKKFFKLYGETRTQIDENILGGVIVRVGNKIFDASLKTQIAKLKQKLI